VNNVPLISLCMIVKDEEELIGKCLSGVKGIVDEIIIVDTGSTDQTVNICLSYGAQVLEVPWEDSFSKARNRGLEAATGKWILWMDADEVMDEEHTQGLRELLSPIELDTVAFQIMNYEDDAIYQLSQIRLFQRDRGYRFIHAIHETLDNSKQRNSSTILLPVTIHHYGYMRERVRAKAKSERNLRLLHLETLRQENTPWCHYYLASEYNQLGRGQEAFEQINNSIRNFLMLGIKPPSITY
jgi:glycosyltransferase involved in cell wall biosynthesis